MANTVTLIVDFNNPHLENKVLSVEYQPGMRIQDALLAAYDTYHEVESHFTFDLRYYGKLGYFVQAMCDVPTTPCTSWEVCLDEKLAPRGISTHIDKPGETITFRYNLDKYVQAA